ncbi:hypothetical protein Nepgr_030713 [Nepenthes gracilis]|uniref:PA domain-containing protein n=1 Tax=Nepenthes gracilis TaxID=150966 RepID=A0AAD3TFY9_NEPGR|nr:hypothetical protein Nepgr_030713 [Nepenthes gracilis]
MTLRENGHYGFFKNFHGYTRKVAFLLYLYAVIVLLLNTSWAVKAGDIVHDDDSAPKKPGCENGFVLLNWVEAQEKDRPRKPKALDPSHVIGRVVQSKEVNVQTWVDGKEDKDRAGDVIVVQQGNCKFTTKPNVAPAAGASAVLIMNSQKEIYKLACKADKSDLYIHILAVMLLQDAGI